MAKDTHVGRNYLKNRSIDVGDVRGHKPIANLIADIVSDNKQIGFSVNRIIVDEIERNGKYPYGSNSHEGTKTDRI
ncbi:MAG: hypothetical protein ACETV1_01670, partial [Candidatus Bathyarchaeia archaeon]